MKNPRSLKARPTRLDTLFWKRFATQVWQKKAMAFPNIDSPLREIDTDRIFQMLVHYADLCRSSNDAGGFKLFLEGARQFDQDTLQFLPAQRDKSLLGYHQRMQKQFPDYCLVCDELLQVSLESWGLLSQFTHQLFRQVGFPNRFSEIGLYLGNYQKTPFGVHVDGCGVFSFPVAGTKTFRIWEESYVQKNPDLIEAHHYDKFKKNSQVLTAQPGDMIYWPSQAWHIAESDGSFNATWSLGVWLDRPHKQSLADTMKGFFEQKLGEEAEYSVVGFKDLHQTSGEVSDLPLLYQKTQKALENLQKGEIQDLFLQTWLAHASKQGLKTFPRPEKLKKLSLRHSLRLRFSAPILWSRLQQSKQTCFAFAGEAYPHFASADFLKLIENLNQGETCRLAKYIKGRRRTEDLQLLQSLQAAGAFTLMESSSNGQNR